jgi:ketol-acid reductoisomerase
MPYKEDIFRELEALLATAEPEQIERLLSDIATGQFAETAQTRAGTNDDRANVTDISDKKRPTSRTPQQMTSMARESRVRRYSS